VIQWQPDNLGLPAGSVSNVLQATIAGQVSYPFSYTANAFNLYYNGVLQVDGTDYTTVSGGYNLTNPPVFNNEALLQQTFARTGAV
jgi:hypothetical protein